MELNTLGDHIRSRRLDLGLFQSQVAEQIGVHGATITNWEGNASSPAVRYIPEIIRFLGYDPLASGTSQRQMAERLGIDPGTLQGWEAGEHRPSRQMIELISRVAPEYR